MNDGAAPPGTPDRGRYVQDISSFEGSPVHYDVLLRCDETSAQVLRAAPLEEVRAATIALLDAMATAGALEDDPLVFVGLTLGEAGHPIDRDALRWVEREPTELRIGLAAHLLTGFWRSCEEPPGWNELGRLLALMKRGSPTAPGGTAATQALTSAAARSDLGAALRVKVSDELSGWETTASTSTSGAPMEPLAQRIRTGARPYLEKAANYDRLATLSALRDLCHTCDQAASFTGRFEAHATGLRAILRCASCEVDVPSCDQRTEGLLHAWAAEVVDADDRQHLERALSTLRAGGQAVSALLEGRGRLPFLGQDELALDAAQASRWVELLLTSRRWVPQPSIQGRWREALRTCTRSGPSAMQRVVPLTGIEWIRRRLSEVSDMELFVAADLEHERYLDAEALRALSRAVDPYRFPRAPRRLTSTAPADRDELLSMTEAQDLVVEYRGGHRNAPDSPGGELRVEVTSAGRVLVESWRGADSQRHWSGRTVPSLASELVELLAETTFPVLPVPAQLSPGAVSLTLAASAGGLRIEGTVISSETSKYPGIAEALRRLHRLVTVASGRSISLGWGAAPPFTRG